MTDTSSSAEGRDPTDPPTVIGDQSGMTADDATVMASSTRGPEGAFPPGLNPQELAHVLRGEVLDHFHLLEFIGGGGMGVVFKAQDTTLNRVVAVKVVASRSISTDELQRRFLVEAQSAARLDHPNIARVHYVGRDRNLPYIVFEYINGSNVRDLVAAHGPMPIEQVVSLGFQISDALAHAWDRDIIHRDIKPSNIVVTAEGQAKLVDMGLARFTEINNPDELTSTGVTLGTFDYISPEQALDPRSADIRSDIYSLGCTLYYMLSGNPPFVDGTAAQKLLRHQDEQAPDIGAIRSEIPLALRVLINRMLSKNPDARQQSPLELMRELAALSRELGIEAIPTTIPEAGRTPARPAWHKRNAYWLLPAAAIVVLAALAAAVDQQAGKVETHPPLNAGRDASEQPGPEQPLTDPG